MLVRELISKLPLPDVPHGTEGLIQTIWLLMTATMAVPLICKLPGGSPCPGLPGKPYPLSGSSSLSAEVDDSK